MPTCAEIYAQMGGRFTGTFWAGMRYVDAAMETHHTAVIELFERVTLAGR